MPKAQQKVFEKSSVEKTLHFDKKKTGNALKEIEKFAPPCIHKTACLQTGVYRR